MLEIMMKLQKTTVKNLQRLAGYLNFLNHAIIPGRVFTRHMYAKFTEKSKILKSYHHVNLDKEFKSDCKIWLDFLKLRQDSNIYRPMIDWSENLVAKQLEFYSDASGE